MPSRPVPSRTVVDPPADWLAVLAGTDLLGPASRADLAAVSPQLEWLSLEAGTELFRAGDEPDGMYLVVRGRLESHLDLEPLGEVARGGTIGETAVLGETRRTASVRAVRDSTVVRVPAALIPVLGERCPAIALGLARLVARRAAAAPPTVRSATAPRSIGVIALDGSDQAASVAREITERLQRTGTARWVTGEQLAAWQAEGGPEHLAARLAAAEDGCDAVVVSVTLGDTTGAGRPGTATGPAVAADDLAATVMRQTDLVVGVAGALNTAAPVMLAALNRVRRPVTLALVHGEGRRPLGTERWLSRLGAHTDVRGHTHLRVGDADDLDRLARMVMGRSVGLVLGGGGARGFAHIGVLRALREAGVRVDRVGGTSMGAVMAAQVALGFSPEEMLAANTAGWSRGVLMEFGIPTLSLLRGRRASEVISGFFGEHHIEDLWLDYFCTTVDLSDFRLHVARSGRLTDWVGASASVPGLWPPSVDVEGHLHVDGGMLDNVPTDVMRASQVGTVIGVDVCNRQSPMLVSRAGVLPTGLLPSGLAVLRSRRRGHWVPSIIDVLNRSNLLASLQNHQHADRHADVFITPPVEDEGFAAFDRVGRLADIGYRSACETLEQLDLSELVTA